MSFPILAMKGVLVFLSLIIIASCATSRSSKGEAQADQLITEEVVARIKAEPSLATSTIVVDTSEGIVTLRGVVEDVIDRNLAEGLARQVEGVVAVRNWLEVRKRAPSRFFKRW